LSRNLKSFTEPHAKTEVEAWALAGNGDRAASAAVDRFRRQNLSRPGHCGARRAAPGDDVQPTNPRGL